jgi:uncharacterized repeat protein (TIGR01451 family)/CSLREA domain-containing protein
MLHMPKVSSAVDGHLCTSAPVAGRRSGLRPRRAFTALSAALTGLLLSAGAAGATTFTVNSAADAPLSNASSQECKSTDASRCTLRAAVQAADNKGGASTITLPAGGYTLSIPSTAADEPANGDLDIKGSSTNVTITGAGGGASIINANHIDRAFAVQAGESLTISGVTVRNGAQNGSVPSSNSTSADDGGAFYNDGSLTIENSVLTGNSAYEEGGVVYAGSGATLTSIIGSTVTENAADGKGGVVYASSGEIVLNEDAITRNTASSYGGVVAASEEGHTEGTVEVSESALYYNTTDSYGGALYLYHTGPVNVLGGSEIDDNTADEYGGGIYAQNTGLVSVEGAEFYGNAAGEDEGGAIYTYDSNLSVEKTRFANNYATVGGAVYVDGTTAGAEEQIKESTFSENAATDAEGGAIYADKGELLLSGSTFNRNNAVEYGGAIYYDSGDGMHLTNDTFDENQAGSNGGALYLDTEATTGTLTLLNDTILHNTSYGGGGIYYPQYATSIQNTIVAENVGGSTADGGGDCYGTQKEHNAGEVAAGGDIDSDGTCFGEGDLPNTDPLLGPLTANGGRTETNALEPGSPAIGNGVESPAACPEFDQRDVVRTGGCDSGAYQNEPADAGVEMEGPSTAKIGEPITYTLRVEDNGPAPATGVVVSDTLPEGMRYFSSSAVGLGEICSASEATVTCFVGTLENEGTASIKIVAIAEAAGAIENTATVSATEEDPDNENNASGVGTEVSSNKEVEQIETTKTVEVTKTVNSVQTETQTVYVSVPTGVSGSTTTETQCKSARSETINWQVPGGVHLTRIIVKRNGKLYRSLPGAARKATVSMVGLPKGAVTVKITGYTRSGQRYVMTRTFHLCVPAKEGGGPSSDYLTKE